MVRENQLGKGYTNWVYARVETREAKWAVNLTVSNCTVQTDKYYYKDNEIEKDEAL